jgi:hypothetical protein
LSTRYLVVSDDVVSVFGDRSRTIERAVAGVRVQAVDVAGGERTWTVLGDDHAVVAPIEEFLEHHRVIGSSPNTVRSKAKALERWWGFLAREGVGWEDPGVGVLRSSSSWPPTG